MADSKISALPAATVPLAGTEVLPIVQSSTTKQVSVANLTAGRAISASSVTNSALTSGRVTYATTGGLLADDVNLQFNSGNLGVGCSPSYKFEVQNTGSSGSTIHIQGLGLVAAFDNAGGDVTEIDLWRNGTMKSSWYYIHPSTTAFLYAHTGVSLGFSTNATEKMRIDTGGIVTMNAYGAGAATFSAAGVISSVSDETWKVKDGVPTNPDVMLQKLEPGYWFYNNEKRDIFGTDRQLGFYAQNVHEAIGEEAAPTPETYVEVDKEGNETSITKPWGYYDRSVLAVAVMSLKNALATIEELKQRITALENK